MPTAVKYTISSSLKESNSVTTIWLGKKYDDDSIHSDNRPVSSSPERKRKRYLIIPVPHESKQHQLHSNEYASLTHCYETFVLSLFLTLLFSSILKHLPKHLVDRSRICFTLHSFHNLSDKCSESLLLAASVIINSLWIVIYGCLACLLKCIVILNSCKLKHILDILLRINIVCKYLFKYFLCNTAIDNPVINSLMSCQDSPLKTSGLRINTLFSLNESHGSLP